MDFLTLNKKKSAIKSPDKIFVAASLKFGKVRQNFVKAKHAGRTRLQHWLTVLFLQSKQTFCLVRPAPKRRLDLGPRRNILGMLFILSQSIVNLLTCIIFLGTEAVLPFEKLRRHAIIRNLERTSRVGLFTRGDVVSQRKRG